MRSPLPSPLVTALPSPLVDPLGMGGGGLNMSCFNFTGSNYASIASITGLTIASGYSIGFWAKPTSIPGAATRTVPFMFHVDINNYSGVKYPEKDLSTPVWLEVVNASGFSTTINNTIPSGWHYVLFVRSGTSVVTYINGNKTTNSGAVNISGYVGASRLFLGNGTGVGGAFIGQLGDISIFQTALTDANEVFLRGRGNPSLIDGCKARYPYPNAAGNARDMIAGNHLTTTGGTMLATSGGPGVPWVTLP